MSFYIAFTIEGDKELSRSLSGMAERLQDWTPAFEKTATTLVDLFSGEVFDTEGAIFGDSWAQLSENYAKQKAKKYPGMGILQATGSMRNGFVSFASANVARVWNEIEYFKYHQSNKPRRKIPRRVMMKLGDNQKETVIKIFQDYLQQIINTK